MIKRFIALFAAAAAMLASYAYGADDSVYINATKELNAETLAVSEALNSFTDKMIKTGKCSAEEKRFYDKKIQDYETYVKSCTNAVWYIHDDMHMHASETSNISYLNPDIQALDISEGISYNETGSYYYNTYYEKAFRRYATNAILYSNNYRSLPAYLANYALKPAGVYSLDGMKVMTRSDSYVELDITNAREYTVSRNHYLPANEYGYGYVKIVSPKGNTYYFTGFSPLGDWNGYFVPKGKGLELNCEYSGRKRFLIDSSGRKSLSSGEAILLSDIFFNQYLKQSSVNWSNRGISFTGKGNVYTININVPKNAVVDNDKTISETYTETGSADGMRWVTVSVNNSENEYYWETEGALGTEIDLDHNIKVNYKDKTVYININKVL